MYDFLQNPILKDAFSPRKSDPNENIRAQLHQSLLKMRANVGQLLSLVPVDCKDLTVHDVSHLDALWEMTSIIAGNKYLINPAEVFVLGAAILLHDAGLTVASFPGGLSELKATVEWSDICAGVLREKGLTVSDAMITEPPKEIADVVKFAVLRALHAKQAERMATTAWVQPGGGEIYLIEDLELRQSFGHSIGRIAYSHNWDIDTVATNLLDQIGVGANLPIEWAVNEKKVACLLRCADAAHMDRRRAPSLLYSALRPTKYSELHWSAQNKVNKPTVQNGSLVYTSGQPFKAQDSNAWWVLFDLVKNADKEIRNSNALLEELKFERLAVQRVRGADNIRVFRDNIQVDGWRPIDAEVRVSDPIHLARTLGGRNLYGRDIIAPVRELLQNCADAIKARRILDGRSDTWGLIDIAIDINSSEVDSCWMHIDDNGVGMSERVLSGPLVDFGRSIWSSSLLHEEFPGLQSKRIAPIGKFGIGFFSVFEIAQYVKVVSKRFEAGLNEAMVLEFESLSSRPLIRPAAIGELPRDMSTRVSLKIEDKKRIVESKATKYGHFYVQEDREITSFSQSLLHLISMLDVDVRFTDRLNGKSFQHSASVYDVNASAFLDEILVHLEVQNREKIKRAHVELIRPIEDELGNQFGRAALQVVESGRAYSRNENVGFTSVGGFTYQQGAGLPLPFVGVIEGRTEQASRSFALSKVPENAVAKWASEQARLIPRSKFLASQLMTAAERVVSVGGDSGDLPYAFASNKLISFQDLRIRIQKHSKLVVVLNQNYDNSFDTVSHNEINAEYFEVKMRPEVIVLSRKDGSIISEEVGYDIVKGGKVDLLAGEMEARDGSLRRLLDLVETVWKTAPRFTVENYQIFQTGLYSLPNPKSALVMSQK